MDSFEQSARATAGYVDGQSAGTRAAKRIPLEEALDLLKNRGFDKAAEVITRRVRQREEKMKLSEEQARDIAFHLLLWLPTLPDVRALHDIMPHSTVELIRAIEERGVAPNEAKRIARYLRKLVAHLQLARLNRFDINHSHVVGREWHEIDYSGENMTWRSQQKYWSRKGVKNFKKAAYIHKYFAHAYELPHFAHVYSPQAKWAGFSWP